MITFFFNVFSVRATPNMTYSSWAPVVRTTFPVYLIWFESKGLESYFFCDLSKYIKYLAVLKSYLFSFPICPHTHPVYHPL